MRVNKWFMSENTLSFAALILSAVGIYIAIKGNLKSTKANILSVKANDLSISANSIAQEANSIAKQALSRNNVSYKKEIAPALFINYLKTPVVGIGDFADPIIFLRNRNFGAAKIKLIEGSYGIKVVSMQHVEIDYEQMTIPLGGSRQFRCEIIEEQFMYKFKKPSFQAHPNEITKLFLEGWFEVHYEDEAGTPYQVNLLFDLNEDRYEGEPVEKT